MELKNKRVLITGGHGFLGSYIVEKLQKRGAAVINPTKAQCDLMSDSELHDLFSDKFPDVVIHCAAKCGGIGANAASPADFYLENLIMGANIIEACKRAIVDKLVLIGTTCSYPKDAPLPLRESDLWNGYPEATNAPYGIAKRTLLTMAQAYREQYGLNFCYLIPANLYGPRDNFDRDTSHVIPAIIRKCVEAVKQKEDTVTLWGDGTPTREFLYVEDAAEAVVRAAEEYNSQLPVNIGNGLEWRISEVARIIADAVGFDGIFAWDTSKPNGQPRRVLDIARMEMQIEYLPLTQFVDGICRTVEWYMSQEVRPYTEGLPMEARLP